jgi:CubicO group peptidase (beta-lactamase class C family)
MAKFPRLARRIQKLVDDGRFAGIASLVWRGGEEQSFDAVGFRDLAAHTPITRDSIFRIASMTKPVIAAAAMTLVEDGQLELEAPISRWLPEAGTLRVLRTPESELDDTAPLARPVTLFDLMTHTAGFAWGTGLHAPITRAMAKAAGATPFTPHGPDELVRRVCVLPLVWQPGTRWHYSICSDLLGVVISRASGESLPDVLQSRLFAPLGMVDSGFWVPPETIDRLATGYVRDADGVLQVHDAARGGFWSKPPAFPAGGGGLVSTLDDYLRFARMLLRGGEGVLSADSVRLMTSNRLTADQIAPYRPNLDYLHGQGFGFGVSVALGGAEDRRRPASFGWPGAYSTAWFADPREDLIAIAMGQLWLDPQNELRATLETEVYAEV